MNAFNFIDKYGRDGLKEAIAGNTSGFIARGNDCAKVEKLLEALNSYEFNNYEIEQDFDIDAKEGDVAAKVAINGKVCDVVLKEFSGTTDDFLAPVVDGFSNFDDALFEDYQDAIKAYEEGC